VNHNFLDLSNVFLGREKELAQLRTSLSRAMSGQGGLVVVSGESGIGKTTLVQHFLDDNRDRDISFVCENFENVQNFEPYAPFIRIIEKLGAQTSPKLITKTAERGSDENAAGIGFLYQLQSQHGLIQQRLLAPFVEAAGERTTVVVLYNVHQAPLTSWKFIHYLSEHLNQTRILVIASIEQDGREIRADHNCAYADVLQRMNREGLLSKVEVEPFTEGDIRSLLFRIFPRKDFSGQFVEWSADLTGGNPALIKNLLARCLTNQIVFEKDGVWFLKESLARTELVELMSTQRDLEEVTKLLASFSDAQKVLLQFAALLHSWFDHHILAAITERSRLRILKDLMLMRDKGVFCEFEQERYRFKHSLLQSAILKTMSVDERQAKHKTIAENIRSVEQIDPSDKIFRLAYHFSESDDDQAAFHYARRASEISMESFAFLEAKDFLDRALLLGEQFLGQQHQMEMVQVRMWACWLDRILGHWDDSIRHAKTALQYLGKNGDHRLKNQILIQEGFTYFRLNDWENAKTCFESCLTDRQSLGRMDEAMASYGLGNVYFELTDYEKSYQYFERALSFAENLQDKQLMANVFNNLGALENIRSDRMKAIALYSKSIPLFKSLGDNFGLARIYHNIGMTHADENNWDKANEFYGQSLFVSDVMGLVPLKSITFLNRALALARMKQFDEAREYNVKAFRLVERLKDKLGLAEYHKIQGIIETEQRNWPEAMKHFEEAVDGFRKYENKLGLAESCCEFATLSLKMQRLDQAKAWFTQAQTLYRSLNVDGKVAEIDRELEKLSRPDDIAEVQYHCEAHHDQ